MLSRIIYRQLAELDRCVGSDAQRASILKLNFSASIGTRTQLYSLRDREIGKGVLETESRIFVDLYPALNVAQANDAYLRISRGGQRQKRAGQGRDYRYYRVKSWLVHSSLQRTFGLLEHDFAVTVSLNLGQQNLGWQNLGSRYRPASAVLPIWISSLARARTTLMTEASSAISCNTCLTPWISLSSLFRACVSMCFNSSSSANFW